MVKHTEIVDKEQIDKLEYINLFYIDYFCTLDHGINA